VVGEKVGGTALLVESAETGRIGRERALVGGATDAGVEDFEGRIEKDDGCRVMGEQLAIGLLKERSAAESEDRGPRQARQDEVEVRVFDGAEAALTAGGEELGNGAVNARDLLIEIDERAGKLLGEQASQGAFAGSHESDEYQQRRWRIVGHRGGL